MASYDKVKLVVVGDSGVGKTSLVHLLCHNEPVKEPYWTIGCSVEVRLHEYKAGTPYERTFFIEMWDVGGFSAHQNSRAIFYNSVNGIILVHDLTNRKSQQNLRKWFSEVINRDFKPDKEEEELDPERLAGSDVPVLIIGTKLDLANDSGSNFMHCKKSVIAEELYADEINLDSSHVRHIEPGTGNAVKLSRFFDKVVEQKLRSYREQNFCMGMERRRNNNNNRSYTFD